MEVVGAGGHPMQVVQVDVILKELGVVAEEVLTERCSGSALEVEVGAAVLEMRWARSVFLVEEAVERKCYTAVHGRENSPLEVAQSVLILGLAAAEVLWTLSDHHETAAVHRTSAHYPPSHPSVFSVAAEAELDLDLLRLIPLVVAEGLESY